MVYNTWTCCSMGGRGNLFSQSIKIYDFISSKNPNSFSSLKQEIFNRIKGIFSTKPLMSVNPYTNLKYLENYIPQLFLYSDIDKLVPACVSYKYQI